jgi:hypothetical protein
METMGPRSATELLQLPVRLHGIRLGRPVDLLLDLAEWRALGFVVSGQRELGELRDLLLLPDGSVDSLVVEQDEGIREVRPAGTSVESGHVSTA